MKRVIKGILIGIILMVALVQANKFIHIEKYIYANKFKFEKFTSPEQLIDFIKMEYPTGSDGWKFKDMLEEAGANCNLVKDESFRREISGTQFMYHCQYESGLITVSPLLYYSVTIYLGNNGKLLNFMVGRYEGFY